MSNDDMVASAEDRLPSSANLRTIRTVVIVALVLLLALRAASELAMMSEHGPDAQMGIWAMFLATKLALWFVGGALAVGMMSACWLRPWSTLSGTVALSVWAVAIGHASWQYNIARLALADASSPTTSPHRLSQLVDFDGIQAGYELDNRLASNPNTPLEALRALSQRDQMGTQMCLARNPNTPKDVLQKLRRPLQ